MIILSNHQLEQMHANQVAPLRERIVARLRRDLRASAAASDDGSLHELARRGISTALLNGIDTEYGAYVIAAAMLVIPREFTPPHDEPGCAAIVSYRRIPAELRVKLLELRVLLKTSIDIAPKWTTTTPTV